MSARRWVDWGGGLHLLCCGDAIEQEIHTIRRPVGVTYMAFPYDTQEEFLTLQAAKDYTAQHG